MKLLYLGVMGACVLVTLPLELVLHVGVYARWRRLLVTLVPVLVVFLAWDAAAVHAGQWSYRHLLGWHVGNLPVEEILFFLVVPTCAVLTFEAVRRRRPGWLVEDEQQ
jgi:lycopene cyclase domain-containing protein